MADIHDAAAMAAVARKLESSSARLATYENVVGWFSDGRLQLEDGRIVTRAELEAGLSAEDRRQAAQSRRAASPAQAGGEIEAE